MGWLRALPRHAVWSSTATKPRYTAAGARTGVATTRGAAALATRHAMRAISVTTAANSTRRPHRTAASNRSASPWRRTRFAGHCRQPSATGSNTAADSGPSRAAPPNATASAVRSSEERGPPPGYVRAALGDERGTEADAHEARGEDERATDRGAAPFRKEPGKARSRQQRTEAAPRVPRPPDEPRHDQRPAGSELQDPVRDRPSAEGLLGVMPRNHECRDTDRESEHAYAEPGVPASHRREPADQGHGDDRRIPRSRVHPDRPSQESGRAPLNQAGRRA